MMFDARRLLVLRAIAEHRSFTRAAEALVMTQPAVSRQLAALEREVGIALVVRGPRHVSLTAAGAALAEEAAAIIPAIERAARRLRGLAGPEGGAVRLGAIPSAMSTFVPAALRSLRDRRPGVELDVREGWSADLVRLAGRGEIDLAVVSAEAVGIVSDDDVILRESFVAVLPPSHPLADRRGLRLAELAGEAWIVATEPGGRRAVLAACARAGFAPRVVASSSWESAAGLIALGLGVALAPRSVAARLRSSSGVACRPLADMPERRLALVRAPGPRPAPAARDLARHIAESARRAGG